MSIVFLDSKEIEEATNSILPDLIAISDSVILFSLLIGQAGYDQELDNIFITGENCLERWHISREMKFEEYKGHVGPVIAILSAQLHGNHESKKNNTTIFNTSTITGMNIFI